MRSDFGEGDLYRLPFRNALPKKTAHLSLLSRLVWVSKTLPVKIVPPQAQPLRTQVNSSQT